MLQQSVQGVAGRAPAANHSKGSGTQEVIPGMMLAIRISVVFLLDHTSSMQPYIDGAREAINGLIAILTQAGLDVVFGLVLFRDEAIGEQTLCFDAGITPERIKSVLAETRADGGGDLPESSLLALRHAVRLRGYPQDARTVFCLVTDADCHDPEQDVSSDDIRAMLVENKVTLFACAPNLPVYQKLVNATGGKLFEITKNLDAQAFRDIMHEFGRQTVRTVQSQLGREMQQAMQAQLRKTRII